MLRLSTFGGLAISRDRIPVVGAATSARRLAILALAAAHGDRGMTRVSLASLLWPDSDPERGRHSLDQAVHALRRALGERVLVGTGVLHLNPEEIDSDVVEFEKAVADGHLERAVRLYSGPFAEGLVVPGASELEQLLDGLRARYQHECVAALDGLARAAAAQGDHALAVRRWRRLTHLEPFNARFAKELIAALADAGESAEALRFALLHERLVREEANAEPSPEIVQWIQRLRTAGNTVSPEQRRTPTADQGVRAHTAGVLAEHDRRRMSRLVAHVGRRYVIERLVEEGAVTAIYAATSVSSSVRQPVEVQVVQSRIASVVEPAHFEAVLRAAAGLSHSSILATLDVGVADDLLYFVTAPRPKPSLRERLRREGALPVAEVIAVARAIAEVLAYAHERGLHHGDLRPKYVGFIGTCAVVDGFGVREAVLPLTEADDRSTVVALGSPHYMSPEQLTSEVKVDARSDIYAFGCMCFEMLVGQPPFATSPVAAGLNRKLNERAPSVRALRDTVPQALEDVVLTCLARQPADRFATASALHRAIAALPPVAR